MLSDVLLAVSLQLSAINESGPVLLAAGLLKAGT
jgi:hypothetical protein